MNDSEPVSGRLAALLLVVLTCSAAVTVRGLVALYGDVVRMVAGLH